MYRLYRDKNGGKGYNPGNGESKPKRAVQAISGLKPPLTRGTLCGSVASLSVATELFWGCRLIFRYYIHTWSILRTIWGVCKAQLTKNYVLPFIFYPVPIFIDRMGYACANNGKARQLGRDNSPKPGYTLTFNQSGIIDWQRFSPGNLFFNIVWPTYLNRLYLSPINLLLGIVRL